MKFSDEVTLLVNGRRHALTDPPIDKTLAGFLRGDLGLRGTKIGCGEGGCGSCTVTVSKMEDDGEVHHRAVNACITKVRSLHGASVTTVEGLGRPKSMHPIQEAVVKNHASQCGFCTPGMVMSMSSRMRESGGVIEDIEDVKRCVQGNLCRCTGYRPIVQGFGHLCGKGSVAVNGKENGEDANISNGHGVEILRLSSPEVGGAWYQPTRLEDVKELMRSIDKFDIRGGDTGWYEVDRDSADNIINIAEVAALKKVEISDGMAHVGSALTLAQMESALKNTKEQSPVTKAVLAALSTLASPQVRNVATVGGNIMWDSPGSDLRSVYLATGCKVKIWTVTGGEKIVDVAEVIEMRSGLIILELLLPLLNGDFEVSFFRKAKRKEFDLSIANACFVGKRSQGGFQDLQIVFGGTGLAKGKQTHVRAQRLGKLLSTTEKLSEVTDKSLLNAVLEDVDFKKAAPEQYARLAAGLLVAFTKSFIDGKHAASEIYRGGLSEAKMTYPDSDEIGSIGKPVSYYGAEDHACGTAVFVDDMKSSSSELQMVLVRAKRPHAKILSIDYSKALKIKGVVGVIDGNDLEDDRNRFGAMDEPVFAKDKVEFNGQVIAGLLCTDLEAGRRAREVVRIEYEDLEAILTIEEAMKSAEVLGEYKLEKNQPVDDMPPKEQVQTFRGRVHIGGQEHFYMEPHAVLVVPSGEKDEMVVHTNTQDSMRVQATISDMLNVPRHKVTVKCKRAGGAFGGKARIQCAYLAAAAAAKFGTPVRLVLERREDMEITGHRHEVIADYEVDVDTESGRLLRTEFECHVNAGMSKDISDIWIAIMAFRIDGGYTLKRFKCTSKAYKTNTQSNTAFRGFGGPEGQIVIDTIMDHVANALGKDPTEVRKINISAEGDEVHVGDGRLLGAGALAECFDLCEEKYGERRAEVDRFNAASKERFTRDRVKRGLSVVPIKFTPTMGAFAMMQAGALIRVYLDGSVLLSHAGIEMGQGLNTKMIQIASSILGVPQDSVHIAEMSTDTAPNASETGGSVGTDFNGAAVMDACKKLRKILEPFVQENPKGSWKDWVNAAYAKRTNLQVTGFFDTSAVNYNFADNTGILTDYWTYAAGLVMVEVDCHTGDSSVLSADLVVDVGKSVNPGVDVGQIEGAFVQGQGYATNEQILLSPTSGEMLTNGPGSYKIPTAADIPKEFNVTLLKHKPGRPTSAVYSSKGIGEPAVQLGCSGVLSAIRDAVHAYRKDQGLAAWFELDAPATADKIRMAAEDEVTKMLRQELPEVPFANKAGFEM